MYLQIMTSIQKYVWVEVNVLEEESGRSYLQIAVAHDWQEFIEIVAAAE